jgi:DNA-binding transcriptional ArsR family regulator
METKEVLKALAALSQENRLAIFRLLVQAGKAGQIVGDIAEELSVANATLSFHLKELTNAGLIEARQEGRYIYYSANYAKMNDLLGFLTENCCAGDSAACASPECAPATSKKPSRAKPASALRLAKRRATS